MRKGDHLGIDQTNYIWLDKVAGWTQTRNWFWKEAKKTWNISGDCSSIGFKEWVRHWMNKY